MDIRLRPALPDDAQLIAAFNQAMARETEQVELDPHRLLAGVRAVLADPSKGFYTLAELGGRIVGQMMITFEWSDWRNANFWWIQSVYVHPHHRNRGVFRRLYQHTLERARTTPGVCGLRLYVDAANLAARRTYQRLGMRQTSYDVFEIDFVIPR